MKLTIYRNMRPPQGAMTKKPKIFKFWHYDEEDELHRVLIAKNSHKAFRIIFCPEINIFRQQHLVKTSLQKQRREYVITELESTIYLCLFEIFGIVNAIIPLEINKNVGMRKVKSQWWPITSPMTSEPVVLPSRPTNIDMQIAMALREDNLIKFS